MRHAFKEWGIIVDALGRGDQIIVLRKGGVKEGRAGFKVEHSRFLLFPTLFHQQRDSVIAPAQVRYDEIAPHFPAPNILRLAFLAEVVMTKKLIALAEVEALRGQHIWREEVIGQRFEWGRERGIFVLAVRVFRLPKTVELPLLPAYEGCKSWVELDRDVDTAGALPVMTDPAFAAKLSRFNSTLAAARPPTLSPPEEADSPASSTAPPVSTAGRSAE